MPAKTVQEWRHSAAWCSTAPGEEVLFLVFTPTVKAYLLFYNKPNTTANMQNRKFKEFHAHIFSYAAFDVVCPLRWTPGLNPDILTKLFQWPCYEQQMSTAST